MKSYRLVSPLILLLAAVVPLTAQNQTPPTDPLAAVRTKPDLTAEDQDRIRAYVTERIALLVGKEQQAARMGAEELRSGYEGSDPFKRAYAAACVEALGSAVQKAELEAAVRMLALLNVFGSPAAAPVFIEALQDERVGIQAAGAVGLAALREKLAAAGREPYLRALTALKEAGPRARSREVLRRVYEALDYSSIANAPDPKANTAAVLEVLEERARQYAAGEVYGGGADDTGLHIAAALAKNMDEGERKRLAAATGTMVKYALEQYINGRLHRIRDKTATREQIELRNGMERLVLVGEDLLTALLKPQTAPAVADAMRKVNLTSMSTEWKKWVAVLQRETNQDFTLFEDPVALTEPLKSDVQKQSAKVDAGEAPANGDEKPAGGKGEQPREGAREPTREPAREPNEK